MSEKSILEQALLQVQTLEEAVKANAKGILASTMKQELNELLKEEEEEVKSEDETNEEEVSEKEETSKPEDEKDVTEQPEDEDDSEEDDSEDEDDSDDEDLSKDVDSMDSGDDLSMDTDTDSDTMDDELPMGGDDVSMDSDDDDVMDLTNASDEEVLKVFKAMKPEDGVVVKKDGDDIELELDGDEYIIKLDGEDDSMEETSMDEMSMDEDEVINVDSDSEMGEETLYEIELDEEDHEESKEEETNEEDGKEIEANEAARTQANDVRGEGPRQGKKFKAGRPELNEEVSKLKKQNDEYKKALVLFKEKLNEVAVFNANLAYATRLFTEHSTTKQEKLNILKRFDSISTMNESKNLFKTIKTELETKKPVTESVVEKISTTPQSSSSKEVLAESKAYENPQFRRMKDLMSKIK
jgi:hypothetical protein